MQFIQFICRRISAIKQSTFLRCSSMCILPCFHLAMSNPLRGSNHDKPRERERVSFRLAGSTRPYPCGTSTFQKKSRGSLSVMLHQKRFCTAMAGKSGVPNPGISRNCSNPGGAGLPFCALFFRPRDGILHGLKVRNTPKISKDHVPHDHGIRAYESHSVITTLHKCSWNLVIKF